MEEAQQAVVHGALAHMAGRCRRVQARPQGYGRRHESRQAKRILADGLRVDGKMLSEIIQAELAK